MNDQPKDLVIPLQVAQAILQYLAQRPYGGVVDLVQALQQLRAATENDTEG